MWSVRRCVVTKVAPLYRPNAQDRPSESGLGRWPRHGLDLSTFAVLVRPLASAVVKTNVSWLPTKKEPLEQLASSSRTSTTCSMVGTNLKSVPMSNNFRSFDGLKTSSVLDNNIHQLHGHEKSGADSPMAAIVRASTNVSQNIFVGKIFLQVVRLPMKEQLAAPQSQAGLGGVHDTSRRGSSPAERSTSFQAFLQRPHPPSFLSPSPGPNISRFFTFSQQFSAV